MNRYKKEEARQAQAASVGLTEQELAEQAREQALQNEIDQRARSIHAERFPEEYDHYYDSTADAADRQRGINPMSAEYIATVAARREELGVSPLSEAGLPTDDSSWQHVFSDVRDQIMARQATDEQEEGA